MNTWPEAFNEISNGLNVGEKFTITVFILFIITMSGIRIINKIMNRLNSLKSREKEIYEKAVSERQEENPTKELVEKKIDILENISKN